MKYVFYVILFMMVRNFLETWKVCCSFNSVDSPGVAAEREKFFCVTRGGVGFLVRKQGGSLLHCAPTIMSPIVKICVMLNAYPLNWSGFCDWPENWRGN
jgi:hypothetical protein